MELGLYDKVALVCGGSRGLGRAIAEELASEGARVVLTARGSEDLDRVVQSIKSSGGQAIGVVGDMTKRADVHTAVEAAHQTFGSIGIAICNVYAPDVVVDPENPPFSFGACSDEDFKAAYNSVVMSAIYVAREVVPDMKELGWGRILNLGTTLVKTINTTPLMYLTHTGRTSVIGFLKSLSWELASFNITVNTIATGAFLTGLSADWIRSSLGPDMTEELHAETVAQIPMRRYGRPDEMAALATFLCSERASFLTGETIRLDGGSGRSYL